jgi:hypothetical protein
MFMEELGNLAEALPGRALAVGDLFQRVASGSLERVGIGAEGTYLGAGSGADGIGWLLPGGPLAVDSRTLGSLTSQAFSSGAVTMVNANNGPIITFTMPPSGQVLVRASAMASVAGEVDWRFHTAPPANGEIATSFGLMHVSDVVAQQGRFEHTALLVQGDSGVPLPGASLSIRWWVRVKTGGNCTIFYGDDGSDTAYGPVVLEAWAVA